MELWRAVESDDVEALARLLPRVTDINARNRNGMTALMKAAAGGHSQVVRLLLERGADPNVTRNDGFTALALAAFFGHTDTVKMLIEFGARAEVVTRSGASAHTWATARTFAEVARYLDTAPRPSIQSRRKPARSRILALGVVASFVLIVCCGLGALVLSKSEAHDLAREALPPPPPAVKKIESTPVTNPQPEPPAPVQPVVKEVRPTINKVSTRRVEAEPVPVLTEKPVEQPTEAAPVVVKPKPEPPKPPALSPQIMAPTKKAKVIQWP